MCEFALCVCACACVRGIHMKLWLGIRWKEVYACVCVCVHACVYVCMYLYITHSLCVATRCPASSFNNRTDVCMCVRMCACMRVRMHLCVHEPQSLCGYSVSSIVIYTRAFPGHHRSRNRGSLPGCTAPAQIHLAVHCLYAYACMHVCMHVHNP
jgi:hypothetical protein